MPSLEKVFVSLLAQPYRHDRAGVRQGRHWGGPARWEIHARQRHAPPFTASDRLSRVEPRTVRIHRRFRRARGCVVVARYAPPVSTPKARREMDEALARDPEKNTAAYLQWATEEHCEAEAGADMGVGVNTAMVEDAGMLAFAQGEQPSERQLM